MHIIAEYVVLYLKSLSMLHLNSSVIVISVTLHKSPEYIAIYSQVTDMATSSYIGQGMNGLALLCTSIIVYMSFPSTIIITKVSTCHTIFYFIYFDINFL